MPIICSPSKTIKSNSSAAPPASSRIHFPPQHTEPVNCAHGRIEWRDIALKPVSAGDFGFVAAAQVARVRRHRRSKKTGRVETETAYLVTSLWPQETTPSQVLAGNRGHWGIENGNHYRRDVTFAEDRCRIRHPVGARVMATLRSLAISLYLWAARQDPRGTPESLRLWLRANRQTMDATLQLLELGG